MAIIKRQLAATLRSLLPKYPILALTGPRQSGKTTLLRYILPNYRYVSLENPDTRSFATEDPVGFLKEYDTQVIFDEVQRAPSLFSYLQTIVDNSKQMGQFVLSGSQNFRLLERITQSLAGRVALFKLLPFDSDELSEENLLSSDWKSLIIKGFYPAIYNRDISPPVFYANYIQTYIDRDVAELSNVQDMRRFRNFIELCAARNGQLLNLNNLANECGISQPTAKSWSSILESSYIVFLLPPHYENFSKRVVKRFYPLLLVAIILLLFWFWHQEQQKVHDYQLVYRSQQREVEYWRDEAGKHHARAQVAEIRAANANLVLKEDLKQMLRKEVGNIRRNLISYSSIQASTSGTIAAGTVDTIYVFNE